jgi:hypothetical protein
MRISSGREIPPQSCERLRTAEVSSMRAYSMSVRFLGEGFGPRFSLRKIVRVREQAANHGLYTNDRKVGSGDEVGVHHLSASPATEPCVANRMLSIAVTSEKTSVLLADLAIKVCRVYRRLLR